MNKDIEED